MPKRFSIGTKIFASLLVILMLVLGSNYFIFMTERAKISKSFTSDLALINNSEQQIIENKIEEIKRQTADFSSDGYIRDIAKKINTEHRESDIQALNTHLVSNKLSLDEALVGINVVNTSGMIIGSTDNDEIGKTEGQDTFFSELQQTPYGKVYTSDFMPSDHFKVHTIVIAVSTPLIEQSSGEHIGALINYIRASSIARVLREHTEALHAVSGAYQTTRTYLVTREGFVIDPKDVSTQTDFRKQLTSGIQCNNTATYKNESGEVVYGLAACLQNGWKVITEIDEAEALTPLATIQKELLILVILFIGAILVVLFLLNLRVIDPLRSLASAAQKIGKGKFGTRTHITSHDEIGDLSTEFDEMAKGLEDSRAILAQRIQEVTKNFEKFKLAVEGASDHVVITDIDGKIIYANKAAEETTGYSQKEMIGNQPSLWGKQMPKEFYQHMWQVIKIDQKAFHGEVTNKRKNGSLYVAETRISPLFDDKKELYGFVAIERDITKQKEVDRAKTEFVSIASHQLRTPLTIINWYAEMLSGPSDHPLSEKQLQYLNEIVHASKRMIELVNSLLNVSRIDLGTFMVEPEPIVFKDALEEVLKDIAPQIAEKKITVVKNIDNEIPAFNADKKLLHMVLQNLLTNAVKYTPEGGTVTAGIEQNAKTILITVADTGMGIPSEQQSKIFQKFFRADNARAKEPDGNGLGLYITRSIIESGGGEVTFKSEEGKGTTFTVSLPREGMIKKAGTRALAV